MTDWAGRELHFIAIGGAGMSGLALVCHGLGARVTRQRPRRVLLHGAPARRRPRPAGRPRRRRRARRTPRSSSRPRSATTTPSSRAPASAASGCCTAASCWPSSARAAPDRGRGHPRQDDDGGDARPRAAGDRRRPGLPARRRAAGGRPGRRRRERRLGRGRVDRRRGRRVRRELPAPAPRGRGRHERRARPPLALGVARRADRGVRALLRAGRAAWRCRPTASSPRSPAGERVLRFDADAPGPARSSCAVPGRHNLLNARAALAALELAGFDLDAAARRARDFPRDAAPARAQGAARRRRDLRRLRPSSDRGRGGARGAARARPTAADRRLPAAPLLAHEGAGRAVRRGARRRRRDRGARRLPGAGGAGRRAGRGQRARRSPGGRRPRRRQAGVVAARRRARRARARAAASARATCWSRSAPGTSTGSPSALVEAAEESADERVARTASSATIRWRG